MLDGQQLLALIVATPFALAALVLAGAKHLSARVGWVMVFAALAAFCACVRLLSLAWQGSPIELATEWLPAIGVDFALRADRFGLMFAMLISGIGALVGIYSVGYMPEDSPGRIARYYAALLAFMGAMLGVALADDLVVLFVFWELTSLSSFLLIGYSSEQEQARKGALTALQVTALGGMTMLAGVVLVGIVCGTTSIRALTEDAAVRQTLVASPAFAPALLLLLAGALTKSAQWPFHFWLPGAMVAPTPISTYLHAATMVKAGVFLLGRLLPLFGGSPLWEPVLVSVGGLTALLGAVSALRNSDLKAILARTTVAQLGTFVFAYGLGLASGDALRILSHAGYKAPLFLVAGIIEHATHTRDLKRLGGLRSRMPITFAIAVAAAISMAGLWPTLGFHTKEANFHALLHLDESYAPETRWLLFALGFVPSALLVAVALHLVVAPFLGRPTQETEHAHEPGPLLWLPPAIVAAAALLVGLVPSFAERLVSSLSSRPMADLHLSLRISGTQLLLLIANLGAGLGIYLLRTKLAGIAAPRVTMQGVWDSLLAATTAAATTFSRRWQNGSIDWYFSGTWLFVVGLATYALAYHGISLRSVSVDLSQIQWYGTLLCAMLASSAVMVVRFTTRVAAAIALTTNGFLTALLFVVYRSPDIVLTQILIETASTIFILLILYFLPPFKHDEFTAIRRFVNMAISVAVGATMFVLVLLITSPEFRERHNLALDYLSRSLADAGGANAVNVIIVDFRAIDTTGEITVLMMVSLIVFGLLRSRRRSAAATASPPAAPRPARPADGSPILRTAARLAMPLTAWVSLVIFLQGHNLPGGGFIAGAMGAAAGATYLLAFGLEAAERVSWWRVATIGLLISVATGAVPFVFGGAYMDHSILHLHLPLVGPYELPTATFFDLGVYLIVLGTIMTMFVELGLEDD